MSKYLRAPDAVKELASEVLCEFELFQPVLDAKVTVGYLFAYPDQDENGESTGPAITVHGTPAIACVRVVNLRDRAKGNADAEITIDATWWDANDREQRKAVLAHELYHIEVQEDKTDDLRRPKLKLRKHDVQFGWFRAIAVRYGKTSQERIQAASLLEDNGQFFFPEIIPVAATK